MREPFASTTTRRIDLSRPAKLERLPLSIFRLQPGEYVREVMRNGKRYLLTKSGKPAALLVPVDQAKEEE